MKKIRLWFHHHRTISCILILFLFLFYLSYSIYQKKDLSFFEKSVKNSVASIFSIFTPRLVVDYSEVYDTFTKEKEEELQNLRELLELSNTSSYVLEHASVIQRNAAYYFNEVTVDKGKSEGIDQGMLAITEEGLIGVVKYVTKDTSTIQLLTEEEASFKISVAVFYKENKYNGIITGYDSENKELLITSIRGQSELEVGSVVKTNGLGNLYPEGIVVGKVSSITYDEVGLSKVLRVASSVDFENIKYASIIKGVKT